MPVIRKGKQVNSIKAKKLDIDFDSLNFDEVAPSKEEVKVPEKTIIMTKTIVNDPINKADAQKLNDLHNMKGISSSDFEAKENIDTKEKLSKFTNSNAISSEDIFGPTGKKANTYSSFDDKIGMVKDVISGASSKVKEIAKKLINYGKQ